MTRHRLLFFLLWVSPVLVYGSAIFAHYGFRDDYSIMREAHEEPGKALAFTASHGRILYGALLEGGFSVMRTVDDLMWLRLASAVLITSFGFMLFQQLKASGWREPEAWVISLVLVFLPAAQVAISWAVGWPWGIALIFTVLGFRLCTVAWEKAGIARYGLLLIAVILYMSSTLIYQSDTLIAVVLLAAVLLAPSYHAENRQTLRYALFHLAIIVVALLLTYGLLQVLYAHGVFHASGRLQFETEVFSKTIWFLTQSLPNAMAFLTLRDNFGTGATVFWCLVTVVGLLILLALTRKTAKKQGFQWLLCIFLLPWIAHGISLVAAERVLGYRTTFALSGLVVVLLVASLHEIFSPRVYFTMLFTLVPVSAWQAYQQSFHLIAEPQSREWFLVKDAVARMTVGVPTSIYLIEPKPVNRSTDRVYRDEYGSFTSNSDWAPKEMFKAAMQERFSGKIPAGWDYTFSHGGEEPLPAVHYDQVIDMRTLSQWRLAH